MRTTLNIDDDILEHVKAIARQRGIGVGKVISELARDGLARQGYWDYKSGVPQFPRRPSGEVVTLELVNELRDEE